MLAARDQENRVFAHATGAASKQQALQPKTPGARFPKTPLKVSLNDENEGRAFGGKTGLTERVNAGNENLRTVGKGSKFVTPLGKSTAEALGISKPFKRTDCKALILMIPGQSPEQHAPL